MMDCDAEKTNLLVYVDGDQRLFELARNLTVASKFKQKLCIFRAKGVTNVGSVRRRRQRIADIHNELKQYLLKCDYVFLIEDDGILPLNALKVLLSHYSMNSYAGFISGAEIGRWGYTVVGVWKIVGDIYNINHIESMIPPKEAFRGSALEECDAAGIYCSLTRRDNYMNHTFKPFEDVLGPDSDWGFSLRQQGFKNYVDWGIRLDHLTKNGKISFSNTHLQQLMLTRGGTVWNHTIKATVDIK